ncbi:tyrosine-type recombinase/integrase [Bacillus pumilus]|uniref:tyrosine-type recombinase/integrase n=1 Tax=Bacillus pumilus TaxID=1408 RepID=UPI0034D64C94
MTSHLFRHTQASLLIEANVSMKVISHRVGHSSIATKDEIYGHLLMRIRKRDLSKIQLINERPLYFE